MTASTASAQIAWPAVGHPPRRAVQRGLAPRRIAGMTLIELMAVVVVIGLLAMIAMPSYRQYSMRAQRTDAKAALLQLQTNQERFYLQNRRYGGTADLAALGFPTGKSEKGAYALTVPLANTETFRAVATPVTGGNFDQTADADCTAFSITAQGVKAATGGTPDKCW